MKVHVKGKYKYIGFAEAQVQVHGIIFEKYLCKIQAPLKAFKYKYTVTKQL